MLVLGRREVEELDVDAPVAASRDEATLYKFVDVTVQDLAATARVLAAARERGGGQEIELEECSA